MKVTDFTKYNLEARRKERDKERIEKEMMAQSMPEIIWFSPDCEHHVQPPDWYDHDPGPCDECGKKCARYEATELSRKK